MKRITMLILISLYTLQSIAQEDLNNSLSTSLVRWEKNSQTLNAAFNLKFISGIEYQKSINRWSFGIKYEHGLNKFNDDGEGGIDHFYGTGFLREDNFYVNANYNLVKLFEEKLIIMSGLNLYYSNSNYSGQFQGGFTGLGSRVDKTYNTFGLAPALSINYFPIKRLYIALNTMIRFGVGNEHNSDNNQNNKINEFVINAPELRIGVKF